MATMKMPCAVGVGGGEEYTTFNVTNGGITTYHDYTLEVGKLYLVEMFNCAASKYGYSNYDGATATNATLTKVGNIRTANDYVFGTYYSLVPTDTSVRVTCPGGYSGYVNLFELA